MFITQLLLCIKRLLGHGFISPRNILTFAAPFLPSFSCAGTAMSLLHYISPMATLTIDSIYPLRSRLPTSLHLSSNLILLFLRPFDEFSNSAPSIHRSLISVPPPEPWRDQFMSSFCSLERMLVLFCIPWSGEQALMAVKLFMSL